VNLVFCADPLDARHVDVDYAREASAAESAGWGVERIDFEALLEGDATRAVRGVRPPPEKMVAVFRGWMMTPERYASLYDALAARNLFLVNTPDAYRHAHYLPESYDIIAAHTPKTVWIKTGPDVAPDRLRDLLRPFGDRPVLVKDFVKSRKHEWDEACFIPSASDDEKMASVVSRFVQRQGDDLQEGLVFREFVPLEPLTVHPKSGMPLTREFRRVYADGEPVLTVPYWGEADYGDLELPDDHLFHDVAGRVRSRFFTMDIARRADGGWIIVELGDAQVAGLPETVEAAVFYRELRCALMGTR
jgi:hypothetical protein